MMNEYNIENKLLEIKGLKKAFGDKLILRDIGTESLPFVINNITRVGMNQGQIIAVVGASGSGKSTLFKMISGMHEPTEGYVHIPHTEKPEQFVPVEYGDVGFVQQSYPLSRNESVQSMLEVAAKKGGHKGRDMKQLIDEYLEKWGLVNQRKLSKNQLSGGQKQRVAIIEQMLCSHHFIIFDEPFSGLDVKNIEDVKSSFSMINTSNDMNTVFFSTHDIELAVELADMIYVMGYERNESGHRIPGGTIVVGYDLKQMGLAWNGFTSGHLELASDIKEIIKSS